MIAVKHISNRSGWGKEPKLTQPTSEVRKPNLGQIHSIDQNLPLSGFYKSEERQRKGTLSGTGPPKDANLSRHSMSSNVQQLANICFAYLLPRVDLEREPVEYVRQLGLEVLQRSIPLNPAPKKPTEYRMTSSLHSMCPVVGQDAGGRGSTNSGGSRSSSEYSLTRSTATFAADK